MASPEDTTTTTAVCSGVTLEALQEWIPASLASDTFRGVERSIDDGARRLTGVRLPPSEQVLRHRAKLFASMSRPTDIGGMHWFIWCLRRASADVIERLDAVSAWENEGGA